MALRILIDTVTLFDLIHDKWFDLAAFTFDRDQHEARLYLGEKRKGPYDKKILKITNVLDVAIDDQAEIGIYDVTNVEITNTSIRLESVMSLVITLAVGSCCEISLIHNAGSHDLGKE